MDHYWFKDDSKTFLKKYYDDHTTALENVGIKNEADFLKKLATAYEKVSSGRSLDDPDPVEEVKAEPEAPKTETKVEAPKAEPEAPKTETKVEAPKAEPEAPKTETKVEAPKAEPEAPKTETKVAEPEMKVNAELAALVASEIAAEKTAPTKNSVYFAKCQEAVNSREVSERVTKQLEALLPTEGKHAAFRSYILEKSAGLKNFMLSYQQGADEFNRNLDSKAGVQRMTQYVFDRAYKIMNHMAYDTPEQIILAQKITDVLLKSYSPIAFEPEKFEEFGDHYLIQNNRLVKEVFAWSEKSLNWEATYNKILDDRALADGIRDRKKVRRENQTKALAKYTALTAPLQKQDVPSEAAVLACKERYEMISTDRAVVKNFRAETNAIFTSAGVKPKSVAAQSEIFLEKITYHLSHTYDHFLKYAKHQGTFHDMMSYMAKTTYAFCEDHLAAFQMPEIQRTELSRQLANRVIEYFSPACFTEAVPSKQYFDSFLVKESPAPQAEEQSKTVEDKTNGWYARKYDRVSLGDGELMNNDLIAFVFDEFYKSIEDVKLEKSVRAQMSEILVSSGVDQAKVGAIVDRISKAYHDIGNIKAYHEQVKSNALSSVYITPNEVMDMMLASWNGYIGYALRGNLASASAQVVAQQKILDILIQNHSLMAYSSNDFRSKYEDQYLLQTTERLQEYYNSYVNEDANFDELEEFVKNAEEARQALAEEKKLAAQAAKAEALKNQSRGKWYARTVEAIKWVDLDTYVRNEKAIQSFEKECGKALKDRSLTESVKGQFAEILTEAGVDQAKINELQENLFKAIVVDQMPKSIQDFHALAKDRATGTPRLMTQHMLKSLSAAVENVTRGSLEDASALTSANEKLTNVILQNYSPVAFTGGALDEALQKGQAPAPEEVKADAKPETAKTSDRPVAAATYERTAEMLDLNGAETVSIEHLTFLEEECQKSMKDPRLAESVKTQIREILKSTGVHEAAIESVVRLVSSDYLTPNSYGSGMIGFYGDMIHATKNVGYKPHTPNDLMENAIRYTARQVQHKLFECYTHLYDRMLVAQKVMDVLLKNYSPAAYIKGIDEKYLHDYLINDEKLLDAFYREHYNRIAFAGELDTFQKGVKEARGKWNRSEHLQTKEPTEYMLKKLEEQKKAEAAMKSPEPMPEVLQSHQEEVQEESRVNAIDLSKKARITPEAVAFFKEQFKLNCENRKLTLAIFDQLEEVLIKNGIHESKRTDISNAIYHRCIGYFQQAYDNMQTHGIGNSLSMTMSKMMEPMLNIVNNATKGCYVTREEEMVKNVRLIDVMLKNYSPVAFADGALDRFADGYFLKDVDAIEGYYGSYINDRAGYDAKSAFRGRVVALYDKMKKQEEAKASPIKEEEKTGTVRESITIDISEAPSQIPMPVPPKDAEIKREVSDSGKERIVVEELSEKITVKEVSEKVKEIDAPVASNVKT